MSLINAILEQLLNGLRTGSIYALIALGYTMVYGIAKMINFAHGDIIMVGAYTIFYTAFCRFSRIIRPRDSTLCTSAQSIIFYRIWHF